MQPWIWWILEGRASLPSPRIAIEISPHRSPSNSLSSSASSDNSSGSLRRCSPALEYVVQYATDVFQQRLQTLAAVRAAIVEVSVCGHCREHNTETMLCSLLEGDWYTCNFARLLFADTVAGLCDCDCCGFFMCRVFSAVQHAYNSHKSTRLFYS